MANPDIFNTTSIVGGNAGWRLSTSYATLMTVDSNKIVKINSINFSSYQGSRVHLYVSGMGSGASGVTTTGADSSVFLIDGYRVDDTSSGSYGASLELLDNPIYLMEGDSLVGKAQNSSASNYVDLFISYEVIDDA